MNLTDICKNYRFSHHQGMTIKAGTLQLELKRISQGWGFRPEEVFSPFDEIKMEENQPGFMVSESALYQSGDSDNLYIRPVLPAKPVVLKNSGMRILPGQSMRFFVKIPLWLQFYHSEVHPENFMTEFPLWRLSDTWFGEPDEGEPALALGNFYEKDPAMLDIKPWEAISPVLITNYSTLLLEVQRLIIRVENLVLVKSGDQIMTSLTEIGYKGREQISSASYHLNKTLHGEGYREIAPARNAGIRSAMKMNFHFIKNIYPI